MDLTGLRGSVLPKNIHRLTDLTTLDLFCTQVTDISALLNLTSLTIVGLDASRAILLDLLKHTSNSCFYQTLNIEGLIQKCPSVLNWLKRLTNQDSIIRMPYWSNANSRPAFSEAVLKVLQYTVNNPSFGELFKESVENATTDCHDRTLYFFNELIEKVELDETQTFSKEKALPVFRKYFTKNIVKDLAHKSAIKRGFFKRRN